MCEVVCNFRALRCGSYVAFVDSGSGSDEFPRWLSWMLQYLPV